MSIRRCTDLPSLKRAGRVLKGGGRAKKKMATGINYCQNGRLAKAKVTLVFWTRALSHSLQGFSFLKRTLKQFDAYGCYGAIFAFRDFKLMKGSCPQRV